MELPTLEFNRLPAAEFDEPDTKFNNPGNPVVALPLPGWKTLSPRPTTLGTPFTGVTEATRGLNDGSADACVDAVWYPNMAATSCAHISTYWASVAMMAGVLMPRKLVATREAKSTRLAAMTGGGTVAAKAASWAAAAACAWMEDCPANTDVDSSHWA
jgi:hypothetical protein